MNDERCWRVYLIIQNVRKKNSSRNSDQDSCREKNRHRRLQNCEKAKTICWIDSSFARCVSCTNNDKFVNQCDVDRDKYDEMNEQKQKIVMSLIKKRVRKFFSFFSSTSFSISSSLKSKSRKRWMMFNFEMFICETIQN